MTEASRAPMAARLFCCACAVAAPAPAMALAEASPPPPAIVVTGQRPVPTPATSESVDAGRLAKTTTLLNAEDSLRYLPSLLVRKRHVGDTQAPLATRTSGVGASARSLVYADGVLLSALIGNNNNFASPRWGMVSPEEIERVDVLYGPFSAAYPGNSIGAVVNLTTRLPDRPEGSLRVATSVQRFDQYGTHGIFPATELSATAGDRIGGFAVFASANHVASRSQPLAYVTVARPAATSAAGSPASGAAPDLNRAGAPILVLGAGGFEHQRQDNLKLKLAFEATPSLRFTYLGGLFLNDTAASARTWLSASGGVPLYTGALNLDGRLVNVPASAFSNNVYRLDERHWMHALTVEGGRPGGIQWRAIGSLYDYAKDLQRLPTSAPPAAATGGPGALVDMGGTGWRTFDVDARQRGLSAGAHFDLFTLASNRYAATDWLTGPKGALTQAARGRTRSAALWAQDAIPLGPTLQLTLGARYEWWRADRGLNFSLAPALSVNQPALAKQGFSPKANLRWRPAAHWSLTLSAGQAYRFPTVSELYQAVTTGPVLTIPDPHLRPERARSEELAASWTDAKGHVRLSLFNEAVRDALIAQTAPLVPGSTSLFSFVQNVPKVRTHGLELVFERSGVLVPGLDLSGSLTLADPKVVRDPAVPAAQGKDLPQVPRRRATMVATWREGERASLTLAARYASRSWGTIDNSDPVSHTFQGFEGYFVVDARADVRVSRHWRAAVGVENLGNDKYYLFHPFPQRTLTAELSYRW
ncbi:MAG: iron complex outerrane recepter protein [Sphingomonadales bacterium]|jgi:iron complex outermembrane receptor protein|nr:iron complex outerrane recepter protein [Sphingomonadales bacterium]